MQVKYIIKISQMENRQASQVVDEWMDGWMDRQANKLIRFK